jgi:hypothetical protein
MLFFCVPMTAFLTVLAVAGAGGGGPVNYSILHLTLLKARKEGGCDRPPQRKTRVQRGRGFAMLMQCVNLVTASSSPTRFLQESVGVAVHFGA